MLSKLIHEGSPHSQLRLLVINLQSAGGEACGMAEVALGDTEFPSTAQVWDFRRRPCSGSRRDGERQNPDAAVQQAFHDRSEEHTSELQSLAYLVCRLLLEKKKKILC